MLDPEKYVTMQTQIATVTEHKLKSSDESKKGVATAANTALAQ